LRFLCWGTAFAVESSIAFACKGNGKRHPKPVAATNLMWTCPNCHQKFNRDNQTHSCNDKTLQDFLSGKSEHVTNLFWHFIDAYKRLGDFNIHPTKTMIGLSNGKRFAFVMRLGKNFVDVMLPFDKAYDDNECFYRIGAVPGGTQFNHYCRFENPEDVNAELKKYMKLAIRNVQKQSKT
jgi:hypothetical protein